MLIMRLYSYSKHTHTHLHSTGVQTDRRRYCVLFFSQSAGHTGKHHGRGWTKKSFLFALCLVIYSVSVLPPPSRHNCLSAHLVSP